MLCVDFREMIWFLSSQLPHWNGYTTFLTCHVMLYVVSHVSALIKLF